MKKLSSMTNQEYSDYVDRLAPKSPIIKDCIWAFVVGGLICVLGQLLLNGYQSLGLGEKEAGLAVSISLVFLSALATGLNVYDDLAKHAGAGTLVPITGFANSVVSPAMEFKAEGIVTGMAAKMFVIAGPVIVFGTTASVVYGVIYWVFTLF
jgi:stage V sporulation protein AC